MSFLAPVPSPIRPTSSHSPAQPRSPPLEWAHDPRLVEVHRRYRWYLIHAERNIAAARAGVSEARLSQLYHEVEAEVASNPAKYVGECPTDRVGIAAWWRKCDAICNFPQERFSARSSREHMIQWWNGFMALQVISTYELDDSPRSDRLLAHANAEAVKVLVPDGTDVTSDERAPGELNQPALLDWVGASFCQRGSTKKYYVEDAGQSLAMGEFFVLRTDGGQREQVSSDTFRNMVHGLVPLEELEA